MTTGCNSRSRAGDTQESLLFGGGVSQSWGWGGGAVWTALISQEPHEELCAAGPQTSEGCCYTSFVQEEALWCWQSANWEEDGARGCRHLGSLEEAQHLSLGSCLPSGLIHGQRVMTLVLGIPKETRGWPQQHLLSVEPNKKPTGRGEIYFADFQPQFPKTE